MNDHQLVCEGPPRESVYAMLPLFRAVTEDGGRQVSVVQVSRLLATAGMTVPLCDAAKQNKASVLPQHIDGNNELQEKPETLELYGPATGASSCCPTQVIT